MVALASFVTHALMATIYFGYSVLTPAWKREFNATSGMTSLVGSAASGFSSGLAPVSSFLSNKFSHRSAHMIGGIIAAGGLFATSFAKNLNQIFIFYGFFGGFGIGMCYLPAVMIMRSYFRRKYSVFIGFASCGIGVGSCVFPLVIEQLERMYGWRGAVLILSGIMANMCVCASIMFSNPIVDNKTEKEVNSKRKVYELKVKEINGNVECNSETKDLVVEEKNVKINNIEKKFKKENLSFLALSRKTVLEPYFFVGVISNFTNFFSMMLVMGLTPMRAQLEFGMTAEQGAILASSIGLSNMVSRFAWGALCNAIKKIDPFKLYCLLRAVTSLVTLLSVLATNFNSQLVCCVILGVGFGSWSLYPIYTPKMFEGQIVDIAYGYLEVMNGIGCLAGPFVGGLIYDVTNSFYFSYMMSGAVLLVGTGMIFLASFHIERNKKQVINTRNNKL